MRALTSLMILLVLTGCASTVKTSLKLPYESTGSSVQIIDQRPPSQKEQSIMSLNLLNCEYGSFQMGDVGENPGRVKVLGNYLDKNIPEQLKNKSLHLKSFTIHVNSSAQLRGQVSKIYGGGILTDAIIQKKVVGCSKDDLSGGYTMGELTDHFPPLIAVIDLGIDKKIYHGRALISLKDNSHGEYNKEWDSLMQEVIIQASKNLVSAIKENRFIEE